jgi:hypothetical protein
VYTAGKSIGRFAHCRIFLCYCRYESEDSGGLINTLKFCFYNYAFLLPSLNTKLTISGLVGFQSTLKEEPDDSRILKYAEAPLNVTDRATTEDWTGFVNVAEYNMSAGLIVVLTAATETVLPRFYCFTVEVKNPFEASPSVPVKVTTSSVNSMSFLMATPAGELPMGKILGWNVKKMGQSSTFPGALNTLTVTISLSGVIWADRKTSVHISNMTERKMHRLLLLLGTSEFVVWITRLVPLFSLRLIGIGAQGIW